MKYTIECKSQNISNVYESYEELRRQRDYYKHVADRHNNLIDNAKFWIAMVIIILFSSIEYDIVYEFLRGLL